MSEEKNDLIDNTELKIEEKDKNSNNNEININNLDDNIVINNSNENSIIKNNDSQNINKNRYFGIDLIRVVACFLVIQTHAGEIYYIGTNGDLIKDKKNIYAGIINSFAMVCVPLFIMISGYLLLPIKTDYKTFLKKRFTRISFPFIAFCIFYDIYYFIKGDIDIKTMLINIPKILLNYGTELGHLWYIYMIMGVYLFIPIQ